MALTTIYLRFKFSLMRRELWKSVFGIDGYEVSSIGRVRSYFKRVSCKGRTVWVLSEFPVRFMKPRRLGGYLSVNLRCKDRSIHSLILEAFVGPRPRGFVACHCDGNRDNNVVENLRWDTPAANNVDKRKHGCNGVRLTAEKVQEIRTKCVGMTNREVAELYGVSHMSICKIRTGKAWNWLKPVS